MTASPPFRFRFHFHLWTICPQVRLLDIMSKSCLPPTERERERCPAAADDKTDQQDDKKCPVDILLSPVLDPLPDQHHHKDNAEDSGQEREYNLHDGFDLGLYIPDRAVDGAADIQKHR